QYTPPGALRRRVELPAARDSLVAEEALDRVDRDCAVELGAVAGALARVVADAPVDRGERVVRDELPPGLLVPALLREPEPGLDVLAGRAARVARRQQVGVDRPPVAHRTGAGAAVLQVGQRCDVADAAVRAGMEGWVVRHGPDPSSSCAARTASARYR